MGHYKLIAGLSLASLLTACGGGTNNTTTDPVVAATQQTASGTITGFGSVFVNGVEWETDHATIEVDDEMGSESDLQVGHVVTVHGSISADGIASADSIEYDAELKGPISVIDLGAGTITVLGYVGLVNDDTIFDDNSGVNAIEDLTVGDFVEINGYPMADGTLLIVHLELETDDGEVEIAGKISDLDTMTSTFSIGTQVIDYAMAALEDFDGQAIANDQRVEVEASSTLGASGELIAHKVELEGSDYDDGDEFEVEGLITAINSDGSIVVAGITIAVPAGVEFEHGTTADVVIDAHVEVEGNVNGPNDYVATKLEFNHESSIEVDAPVQAVDITNGTITALGIVFHTKTTTQYEDDSVGDMVYFDLSSVNEGDWVEIKAYTDTATGDHLATRVERDDADDLVELEGPIDSIAGDQIMVLGVTINANADMVAGLEAGMYIEVAGIQTADMEISAVDLEIAD